MDPLRKIETHLTDHAQWAQKLSGSLYQYNDDGLVSYVDRCSNIDRDINSAFRLASQSKLDKAEVTRLRQLIGSLAEQITSIANSESKFMGVISASAGLVGAGCNVLQKHTLLTGMSEGFLGSSRDHVHDDHFEKITVCSLRPESIAEMRNHIKSLLNYGNLVPLASARTDAPLWVKTIQSIIMGYGIGLSDGSSNILFREPPEIWQDIQENASEAKDVFKFVLHLQDIPDAGSVIRQAVPIIDSLFSETSMSEGIKLDGFFGPKKGIEELRSAIRTIRVTKYSSVHGMV